MKGSSMPKYIRMPERIRVFENVVPNESHARKVLEEAGEVLEAWGVWDELKDWSDFYDDFKRKELVDECADVIQATTNLLFALGVKDATEAMKRCEVRNEKRGRYSGCDGKNGESPVFDEDAEALAWVRSHGGLATVEAVWKNEIPLALALTSELWPDGMPDDCTTEFIIGELHKRLMPAGYEWDARLAGAVEFFESMHDLLYTVDCEEEHDGPEMVREVMRRLMPEGCKWPRYESGAPVQFGDAGLDVYGKRRMVKGVKFTQGGFVFISDDKGRTWWANDRGPLEDIEIDPDKSVKRPAVPASDGEPLEVGQTVWSVNDGREYKVVIVDQPVQFDTTSIKVDDGRTVGGVWVRPDNLTHERPDRWERLEEDARSVARDIAWNLGNWSPSDFENVGDDVQARVVDLVRRARALADRGEK